MRSTANNARGSAISLTLKSGTTQYHAAFYQAPLSMANVPEDPRISRLYLARKSHYCVTMVIPQENHGFNLRSLKAGGNDPSTLIVDALPPDLERAETSRKSLNHAGGLGTISYPCSTLHRGSAELKPSRSRPTTRAQSSRRAAVLPFVHCFTGHLWKLLGRIGP